MYIRQIYVFIEVLPMQIVHNIPPSVSTGTSNSLRAFIIFLILLCLFAFLLDGSSLHSIIVGCKTMRHLTATDPLYKVSSSVACEGLFSFA